MIRAAAAASAANAWFLAFSFSASQLQQDPRQLLLHEIHLAELARPRERGGGGAKDGEDEEVREGWCWLRGAALSMSRLISVLLHEATAPLALLLALDGGHGGLVGAGRLLATDAALCRAVAALAAIAADEGAATGAAAEVAMPEVEGNLPACSVSVAIQSALRALSGPCIAVGSGGSDSGSGSGDGGSGGVPCVGAAMTPSLEAASRHALRAATTASNATSKAAIKLTSNG